MAAEQAPKNAAHAPFDKAMVGLMTQAVPTRPKPMDIQTVREAFSPTTRGARSAKIRGWVLPIKMQSASGKLVKA